MCWGYLETCPRLGLLDDGHAVGDKDLSEYLEAQGYADAAQWVSGQALGPLWGVARTPMPTPRNHLATGGITESWHSRRAMKRTAARPEAPNGRWMSTKKWLREYVRNKADLPRVAALLTDDHEFSASRDAKAPARG